MQPKEIIPLQGSNSLSVSQDGHVHADMTFITGQFVNWIDNTPKEEVQRAVNGIAIAALLIAAIILLSK